MEETCSLIKAMSSKLDSLMTSSTGKGRSSQINELAGALAKAQGQMRSAMEGSVNTFHKSKYANLHETVKAARIPLSENGLSVVQQITLNDEGQNIMHSILMHSSGQWIESTVRIAPPATQSKNDIQAFGSQVTYLRRYSFASLVGVTAALEDDDGERAMEKVRIESERSVSLNAEYEPVRESAETLTKDQLEEVRYELNDYPEVAQKILNYLKIDALADIPKSRYRWSLENIRRIKGIQSGDIKTT